MVNSAQSKIGNNMIAQIAQNLPALLKARRDFSALYPADMVARSGASYKPGDVQPDAVGQSASSGLAVGRFTLKLWDREYWVGYPHGHVVEAHGGREPDSAVQIVLLHYLIHADGMRPCGEWIAFRELPGGHAYDGAFQRETNQRLAQAFGARPEVVLQNARLLGGKPLGYGDASFSFLTLPHLALAVILHREDEEFSAAANVLYDAVAAHCLPTEDLAVVGELLVDRLTGKV